MNTLKAAHMLPLLPYLLYTESYSDLYTKAWIIQIRFVLLQMQP